MPVSHIGLTVSHLPTSCSFFLSALQSLGYRFIGQQGNQIGLGIHDADFFLCQETPGVKAGAAHIAFTAPSRTAVRDFYTAALNAGGRPNGAPASRTDEPDHFNAAVLDFDGNSIEVVYRGGEPDVLDNGTVVEHSRVITWQRSVSESCRDDRSVVSSRTARSNNQQALVPAASVAPSKAPSKAPSIVSAASTLSKAASMVRSVSAPVPVPQVTVEHTSTTKVTATGDGAAKKIIGTLLGAAAGAAVAYAMVKGEEDSAKQEAEFEARQRAQAAPAQAPSQPQLSMQDPQPIYEAPPRSVHRNISDTDSQYSTPQSRSVYMQRAIEPAPRSYHSPSYTSVPPTQVSERRAIEYVPAASVAPSRSQFTAHRSYTDPELLTVGKARSSVSTAKPQSVAPSAVHSTAPSTLISSFVPDQIPRRSSEGSVHSHTSSRSKSRSHVSKHSSTSRHTSKSRTSHSRAPSPSPPLPTQSKAASIVGSILGRDAAPSTTSKSKHTSILEIEDLDINDTDTVAPSDSISNAGSSSRRSHRSHRSSRSHAGGGSGSVVSKHSSASRHSKASKHSSHHSKKSHRSHSRSSRHSHRDTSEYHDSQDYPNPVFLPTVLSEPSDASTVKPYRPASSSSRKDSVAGGQYDAMFNGGRKGSVASLPVRGITRSMIDGAEGEKGECYYV